MQTYFIANWKLHKTVTEAQDFLNKLSTKLIDIQLDGKEIVVCPSFISLSSVASYIHNHKIPVSIGAQSISNFAVGAYTGEVCGSQIREFADYVIVGHSERRRFFGETNEIVEQKVKQAREAGLTVILCVQDENEQIPNDADILAFEPIYAIGTGNPEDPGRIGEVFKLLREKTKAPLLYGGSVTPDNISDFKNIPLLSGFLVGGASLEADSFIRIISQ